MTDQERRLTNLERAYRLAFGGYVDGDDPGNPAIAWEASVKWLANAEAAIDWAILALALLPEGGGVLGRWECQLKPAAFGCGATSAVRPTKSRAWTHELAPGAYLDGTAQELLLLMCAADELARREVQLSDRKYSGAVSRAFHLQVVEGLSARIAELEASVSALADELMALSLEAESDTQLIARQADLLRGVVDAIRGPHPDPLTRWSVHDAPGLAAALAAALRELVEEVEDADCLHRTTCPKCDHDPEESIGLCPYHKAKQLLDGA